MSAASVIAAIISSLALALTVGSHFTSRGEATQPVSSSVTEQAAPRLEPALSLPSYTDPRLGQDFRDNYGVRAISDLERQSDFLRERRFPARTRPSCQALRLAAAIAVAVHRVAYSSPLIGADWSRHTSLEPAHKSGASKRLAAQMRAAKSVTCA